MKRWIGFLLAFVVLLGLHEGVHAATAAMYGELEGVRPVSLVVSGIGVPAGVEVLFRTPVEGRSGVQWALISGASNVVTVAMGYSLLLIGGKSNRYLTGLPRLAAYYLTLLALLVDPLNLSLGPFVYGGDAEGIAVGLGISRYLVQGVMGLVLLVNRELVAQKLLPTYGVETTARLFRPWFGMMGEG